MGKESLKQLQAARRKSISRQCFWLRMFAQAIKSENIELAVFCRNRRKQANEDTLMFNRAICKQIAQK